MLKSLLFLVQVMKYNLFFLILFWHYSVCAQAQGNTESFRSPVDIEILLSGNFAELRGSHFHTGIDIKTKGSVGHNIYAIEDGYVSRIKVSPYGYGNALYIRHPNGYTSVYGHLQRFNIHIEDYVRKQQYARKTFAVNLYPEKDLIKVNRGDVIALSGNSGSSMGPHLHFEIRTTDDERPQNPLLWDFDVVDNIAPRFHNLILYPLSKRSTVAGNPKKRLFSLRKNTHKYFLKNGTQIKVADTIGIGVYVNDYLNNTYNRCGVNQLKVFVDQSLVYYLDLDELSFAENRYILSHMDYALKVDRGIKAHKCFIEPGNQFSGYKYRNKEGKIYVAEGETKTVDIHAIDAHGNKSELSFQLKGVAPAVDAIPLIADAVLRPDQTNHFERDSIHLTFPPNSIYKTIEFTYSAQKGNDGMYSDIHQLHDYHEPVHKRYNVAIKTYEIPYHLKNKLFLASIDEKGEAKNASSSVRYDKGWAHTRIREFGTFALMVDTTGPVIDLVNIYENKEMSSEEGIAIKITDEQTGIDSYNGFVNGQWVLFSYDAKNDLLFYEFDEYMPEDSTYQLKLIVSDSKHNTSVKTINFKYSKNQSNL